MDPKLIKAALDALIADDKDAAIEILKGLVVTAAGGSSAEPPPAADAGATQENAETPPTAADDAEKTEEMAALGREAMALVGAKTAAELREKIKTGTAPAADEGADAKERRDLVAELVKLGVETPATAWEKDAEGNIPEGDARKPRKRLAEEEIVELRDRVSALRKASGTIATRSREVTPPVREPERSVRKLSRDEQAYCKREGISEQEFNDRRNAAVRRV